MAVAFSEQNTYSSWLIDHSATAPLQKHVQNDLC